MRKCEKTEEESDQLSLAAHIYIVLRPMTGQALKISVYTFLTTEVFLEVQIIVYIFWRENKEKR